MVGNLPDWPSTLPARLLAAGYSQQNQDNLVRFAPERGQQVTRPLYTRAIQNVTGNLRLSNAQKETLRAFYNSTLASGSLSFNWLHPDTGNAAVCKFTQPPAFTPVSGGLHWQAAISMEVT